MTDDRQGNATSQGDATSRRAVGGRHQRPRRLRLAVLVAAAVVTILAAVALAVTTPWSDEQRQVIGDPGVIATPTPTAGDPAPSPPPAGDGSRGSSPPEVRPRASFPDGTTTGVPDGVQLRPSGAMQVREDGAVVENLSIVDGGIDVYADDVTIRNVRITNEREFQHWGILQREGASGLTVEDSEVFGNPQSAEQLAAGISNHGGMIEIRRVEVHSTTDGVVLSHGLLEDSYVHSPRYFEDDHTDMVQANGGPQGDLELVIRNNTIINTEDQTGAVALFDNFRRVQNVLVENNYLAGGGYTVYGGGLRSDGADPANIIIRDNIFGRDIWPDSGHWGPVAYFDPGAPGNVWQGNVWADDGTPVLLEE